MTIPFAISNTVYDKGPVRLQLLLQETITFHFTDKPWQVNAAKNLDSSIQTLWNLSSTSKSQKIALLSSSSSTDCMRNQSFRQAIRNMQYIMVWN